MTPFISRRKFLAQSAAALAAAEALYSPQEANAADELDRKIGQMIITHFSGLTAGQEITRLIRDEHLGGVLILEANFGAAAQPKKSLLDLTKALRKLSPGLLIAMDQEGGAVNRLKEKYGFPKTYSTQNLGQRNDLEFTKSAAMSIASTLGEMGINHNFAPVVDVLVNPDNPVVGKTKRCFSADPDIVAEHAAVFIKAHREKKIITTLKHFPGHGSSTSDSHYGLTDVSSTWDDKELIPYRRLIKQNLVDAVMTAHLFNAKLDGDLPASLSQKTIDGLLRDKLGFDGVVISDDLLMGAINQQYSLETSVRHAINAGNDMLLFTTTAGGIIPRVKKIIRGQVESGDISPKRIDESFQRIQRLKGKL